MFKMSTCGVGLVLAGLVGLACSNHTGLNLGGGSTNPAQGISGTGGSTGGDQGTSASEGGSSGGQRISGTGGSTFGNQGISSTGGSIGGDQGISGSAGSSSGGPGISVIGGGSGGGQGMSGTGSSSNVGQATGPKDCEEVGGTCQPYPGPCFGGLVAGVETQYSCGASGALCCLPVSSPPISLVGGAGGSELIGGSLASGGSGGTAGSSGTSSSGGMIMDSGDAGATTDAGLSCSLSASQYDSSCTVDSDCVGVPSGDPCAGNCLSVCPMAALNVRVASQYLADLGAVMSAHNESPGVCSCPAIGAPSCCRGVCSVEGCSTAPDPGVAKDAGLVDTALPACPMLASLNSTDAAQVGYTAGQMLIKCAYAGGAVSICVSNDATACSVSSSPVGDSAVCSNLCTADEYGLIYPGVSPLGVMPSIDLPAGCRLVPRGSYCCPCGT
jgi:hypothetical protein